MVFAGGFLRRLEGSGNRADGSKEIVGLSELGAEEDRLRRQRAHDVARTLESLHLEESDVDLQIMAIAQRYVDGEISIDELMVAIEARSTDVL